jgi:hypothetical protein
MNKELILLPVIAMVLLTAIVWCRLYVVRVREIRAKRVRVRDLATRAGAAASFAHTGAADNFMNLFELPVLFYVLCGLLYATGLSDPAYVWLAAAFVALRAVHSAIHVTYNHVMHRFFAYVGSSAVLWLMWLRFSVQLARQVL